MMQWNNKVSTTVRVREYIPVATGFRVTAEGKLMPLAPDSAPVAYPRHTVTDDKPTGEQSLSARFFESNPAHLIARRTGTGVWPPDSLDTGAVKSFEAGQVALYKDKDANAAIVAYEAAVEQDAGYIKAWVALAIAYITDNTAGSLDKAQKILSFLAELVPGEWLSAEASGIVYQNRAYLFVHRFRQSGESDSALLANADADYAVCDSRTEPGRERLEYLCPWAYVKWMRGDTNAARLLWNRAKTRSTALDAPTILAEYANKYAPLREL